MGVMSEGAIRGPIDKRDIVISFSAYLRAVIKAGRGHGRSIVAAR